MRKYKDYYSIKKMEYHQGNTEMILRHSRGRVIRLVSFPSDKQHGERFDRTCTIARLFIMNDEKEYEQYNKQVTLNNITEICGLLDDDRFSIHEVNKLFEELERIEIKNREYLKTLNPSGRGCHYVK